MDHFENCKFQFVKGNSQCETTIQLATQSSDSAGFDFVFIDGDHSYEGVKRDFELYEPNVRSGGIIALHDIKNPETGVPALWDDISSEYDVKEIHTQEPFDTLPHVDEERQERIRKYGGIGVVYL